MHQRSYSSPNEVTIQTSTSGMLIQKLSQTAFQSIWTTVNRVYILIVQTKQTEYADLNTQSLLLFWSVSIVTVDVWNQSQWKVKQKQQPKKHLTLIWPHLITCKRTQKEHRPIKKESCYRYMWLNIKGTAKYTDKPAPRVLSQNFQNVQNFRHSLNFQYVFSPTCMVLLY